MLDNDLYLVDFFVVPVGVNVSQFWRYPVMFPQKHRLEYRQRHILIRAVVACKTTRFIGIKISLFI